MNTPAVGDPVFHPDKGVGVVTSVASRDWLFVKFLGYVAPRMCRVTSLEAL